MTSRTEPWGAASVARSSVFKLVVLTFMLTGLPLLGVHLTGADVGRYLEFPPRTRFVVHAAFSWPVFLLMAVGEATLVLWLFTRIINSYRRFRTSELPSRPFPWWARIGLVCGILFWILAWTRFPWFESLQPHTFTPLWLSFILVVNGLSYRKTGRCMMLDRPVFFLSLFAASSLFWWYFEYLNRFVQNWYYSGVQYGPLTYFLLATLSFSTVLPAVLGVREWLMSFDWFKKGFSGLHPLDVTPGRWIGWAGLALSSAALAGMGVWPDYLYPLVWIAPLMVILSLQVILGERTILSGIVHGEWCSVLSAALAALICGWFWEMWNYWSLAKWHYAVPFVHGFQVFEMPLLGYAGYLPFGLECLAVGDLLDRIFSAGNRPAENR